MKYQLSVILILMLTLVFSVNAQKTTTDSKQDNSQYRQLVEKVKKGDANVNFGLIRKAFAEWVNDRSNSTDAPNRDEMVKAFESKDYAKAVKLGEIVVDYEFLNKGLLLAMEDAYRKLGNTEKADFYHNVAHKVGHSVLLSGDGKTAQTAFYVLSIPEEYRVMREFGYTVSSQSLMHVDGQAFDVLDGKDEKGKAVTVYFNICSFFGCGKK